MLKDSNSTLNLEQNGELKIVIWLLFWSKKFGHFVKNFIKSVQSLGIFFTPWYLTLLKKQI